MNKRIHYLIFILTTFLLISACRKSDNKEFEILHDRFNGKYAPISSISSEAIDINQDGSGSTNMLVELEGLEHADLELRILRGDQSIFSQFWPEQYFTPTDPVTFDPMVTVNYANQGVARRFVVNAEAGAIQLLPDSPEINDPNRFTRPETVSILVDDEIQVKFRKTIYTAAGWKSVDITTVYRRYTKIT